MGFGWIGVDMNFNQYARIWNKFYPASDIVAL